jgi:hypothetical protein
MWLPPNRGHLIGNHFLGASAPVEEPFHSIKTGKATRWLLHPTDLVSENTSAWNR